MNEIEVIKVPQNIFIITLIKGITNINTNKVPFNCIIKDTIQETYYNLEQEKGTEYKVNYKKYFKEEKESNSISFGILFNDFFRTDEIPNPTYNDKHLKMILYLLSKWETNFEFLATEFNELCGIRKTHNKNIQSSYTILKDLLNIEIRILNQEIDIEKNIEKTYYPFINLIERKQKIYNIQIAETKEVGVITKSTLSKAKLELGDLIDLDSCGQMLIPTNLFKLKIDKNNLGATSILFNLLYIQAVKNNKNEMKVTYNISTVLEWIGITKKDYEDFFNKNKKMGYTYYKNKLKKLFQQLGNCGITHEFKDAKVKNKMEFYHKEQVIFNLTELKKSI